MNKKGLMVIVSIIVCLCTILFVGVEGSEKKEKNDEKKQEVFGPKTLGRTMYERIITMLEEAQTPTLHDDNGDPFKRIFASASGDGRLNYIQYDIYDEKTEQEYLYFVYDFADEYNFAKKHGQSKTLSNGKDLYIYEGQYTWYDEKTGYYHHILSMNEETTTAAVIEDIILSLDYSIHHILNKTDYKTESKIAIPTYTISKNPIQEMSFEYVKSRKNITDEPTSVWLLNYDDFQLEQSLSYEYTSDFKNKKDVKKEEVGNSFAYINEIAHSVAYTDEIYGSILLTLNEGKLVEKGHTNELLMVIESLE